MKGFLRVASVSPSLAVADVSENVTRILACIKECDTRDCSLVVFPELSLSGYTCADLFNQRTLLDACDQGLQSVCRASQSTATAIVIGVPVRYGNGLYNCAAVIQGGRVLGVVPKTLIPNYKEFYEKRWFQSGQGLRNAEVAIADATVPFGTDLIFDFGDEIRLGIELCEDLWCTIPPSSKLALAGATVIANLSASNELVSKADYRRTLVLGQSARCVAGYVYASSGVGESSTDLVFGGHTMIAENGVMLAEGDRFRMDDVITVAEIDCERMAMTRFTETSMPDEPVEPMRTVKGAPLPAPTALTRGFNPHPFVPGDPQTRSERCREIFNIQASGLAKRLSHAKAKAAVIGVSGGLDSTLALLVAHDAVKRLGWNEDTVIAVTMPGFGTTGRTYDNAVKLCKILNTTFKEISISDACMDHFKAIDHDPTVHDVTYENVQARERTKILMNLANKHGGIVIGTGDLSEMALGWSTYNGDHMSMYGVNCSVPKTLVSYVISWVKDETPDLEEVLADVLDTPISPELLPKADDDTIVQKTEEVVGPYELHDFFLYHVIKYGARPDRVLNLATLAFDGRYDEATIRKWLTVFVTRFFQQQFKRSCVPDGPKVGTISLSPRGDWRMPSDAVVAEWLKRLEQ